MRWFQNWKARREAEWQAERVRRAEADASMMLLELEAELGKLRGKAVERKSHDDFNKSLNFREFLDVKEKEAYSAMARRHLRLAQGLKQYNRQFKYFDKHYDTDLAPPPPAYVSVSDDRSNKITYEWNSDRTKARMLENGKPVVTNYSDEDGWSDKAMPNNPVPAAIDALGLTEGDLYSLADILEIQKDDPDARFISVMSAAHQAKTRKTNLANP